MVYEREKEGGEPKRKAALRALCSYTVRGKSFLFSKDQFKFYVIIDDYLFSLLLSNLVDSSRSDFTLIIVGLL